MQVNAVNTFASLVAAGTAYSPIIDLGTDFLKQAHLIAQKDGTASAGESLTIEVSANANMSAPSNAPAPGIGGDARSSTNSTSAATMQAAGRLTKRYARAKFINGATPQTALTLTLSVKVREL